MTKMLLHRWCLIHQLRLNLQTSVLSNIMTIQLTVVACMHLLIVLNLSHTTTIYPGIFYFSIILFYVFVLLCLVGSCVLLYQVLLNNTLTVLHSCCSTACMFDFL